MLCLVIPDEQIIISDVTFHVIVIIASQWMRLELSWNRLIIRQFAHYLKKGFHSFQVFAVTFEVLFELGSLTDFLHHFMEAIKCSNEST